MPAKPKQTAKRTTKPREISIELRGGWRVLRVQALLLKVSPKAEPWDAGTGVVDLLLLVKDEAFPKTEQWYRLAEPMVNGKKLAEQIVFLKQAADGKKPVVVSETTGRTCQCERKVSSPFCPSCGTRNYADTVASCGPADHGRISDRATYCPFCGRYLADAGGGTRAAAHMKDKAGRNTPH